ncbi:integral membrane protein [Diaporthe amygdali]|uniref:uncharacterized protein n=1 Tax=Phomopsis amygdali TaxID=1214568 RepID=UPI0022FDBAAC|nr:uncharacterized protein J7T55_015346 [Diaporthe amygdali]KAJ0120616.1 integral membrane protein [Diaporthe amygdali]
MRSWAAPSRDFPRWRAEPSSSCGCTVVDVTWETWLTSRYLSRASNGYEADEYANQRHQCESKTYGDLSVKICSEKTEVALTPGLRTLGAWAKPAFPLENKTWVQAYRVLWFTGLLESRLMICRWLSIRGRSKMHSWKVYRILLSPAKHASHEMAQVKQGATPPPPGRTPNFENPEDVLHTINLVSQILSVAIVTPVVSLRLYITRWKNETPFRIDDWSCLISLVLSNLYSSTAFAMNAFGGGFHSWEISSERFSNFLKALYADTVVYGPNAWFVKVTLLLVMIRVFNVSRGFVIFGYSFIAAMLGYYLPVMIIKINICRPIMGFWNLDVPSHCFNQRAIFVADTVISAVTDLVVLLAPIPLIGSLRMPWRQKMKVYLLLGAGGTATAASFVRMYLVIMLQRSDDQTVDFVRFNLLGTAEFGMKTPKFLQRTKRKRPEEDLTWTPLEPLSRTYQSKSTNTEYRWISGSREQLAEGSPNS